MTRVAFSYPVSCLEVKCFPLSCKVMINWKVFEWCRGPESIQMQVVEDFVPLGVWKPHWTLLLESPWAGERCAVWMSWQGMLGAQETVCVRYHEWLPVLLPGLQLYTLYFVLSSEVLNSSAATLLQCSCAAQRGKSSFYSGYRDLIIPDWFHTEELFGSSLCWTCKEPAHSRHSMCFN